MTYRYIAVIQTEYHRLLRAAKFRGFVPGTNIHSYRTYAYLAGMLFVRASRRASRVYDAMRCRGFNGEFHTLDTFSPGVVNHLFLTLVSVTALGLVLTETLLM
jgi:cobalt/nickel transport system permease protein